MPVVLDGNNLLHSLPPGSRSRHELRRLLLELTRRHRVRATLVFDGPPPAGSPERESLGALTVVYAGPRAADDVILSLLPGGSGARQWSVVTADRQLARQAREAGAAVRTLREWRDRLAAAASGGPAAEKPREPASSDEVAEWEEYLSGPRPDDC